MSSTIGSEMGGNKSVSLGTLRQLPSVKLQLTNLLKAFPVSFGQVSFVEVNSLLPRRLLLQVQHVSALHIEVHLVYRKKRLYMYIGKDFAGIEKVSSYLFFHSCR